MEAAVVSFVVDRLGEALFQDVFFLQGVRENFLRLQRELTSMMGLLETINSKNSQDPDILIWIADIRDVAYDVDDIIDAFFLKVASKGERNSINVLKRYASAPKKIVDVNKIGKEIKTIFRKIEDVSNRRKRYGITDIMEKGEGSSSLTTNNELGLRRSYGHDRDADVIGFEKATDTLIKELMKDEEWLCVVSIYGIGGLGKTTLAKKVYNHDDVKSSFDCRSWTFISQQCRTADVLQDILRQVSTLTTEQMEKKKEVELVQMLYTVLEEQKYLVLLDDIWSKEAWDMLKPAFPNGKTGSKILLTTRIKEVANHADPWSCHYEPETLDDEQAWNLLCKKAIPKNAIHSTGWLSSDLENCGRNIVKRCGGLPLAIVVVGGILATKKSLSEWETVSQDIGKDGIFSILALSYKDLPCHLKPCFLYLGLFPEDWSIGVNELIRMWVAQSMVSRQSRNQANMEDVGRGYLNELVERSMVQIDERLSTGGIKTCRLHDMMREFCIVKAREESFFEIIQGKTSSIDIPQSSTVTSSSKLWRCSIHLEGGRYVLPLHLAPSIRTVLFFNGPAFNYGTGLKLRYQDLKLVRVMHLRGVLLDQTEFCKVIGKLVNLRYLNLRGTNLKKLPKSIGNLVFLQCLDVKDTYILRLPNVIWKMKQLRHLHMNYYHGCLLKMERLKELRSLAGITSGPWTGHLLKFTNLQRLHIRGLTTDTDGMLMDSIATGLNNLRHLSLSKKGGIGFTKLERLSEMIHLVKLRLEGKVEIFPSQWPPNILILKLYFTGLNQDPMPTLERLQNLEELYLYHSYNGKQMVSSYGGFPQLKVLHIGSSQLEEWIVEQGAMPCLTTCTVWCSTLKTYPEGLKSIATLKDLEVSEP